MRSSDDGRDDSLIINPMIVCDQRRNKPRLDYKICEATCCATLNGCENYRAWYKKNFNKDLEMPKKKTRKKNRIPTREDIQKREEQIAGKAEAYSILTQAITTKPTKSKTRKPRNKRSSQS